MESKLVTLFTIRSSLDRLCNSKDDIIAFVKHLLDNNHESTVISGIFRQLYREGEKNSMEFYSKLLNWCTNTHVDVDETKQNSKENKNNTIDPICGEFDSVPDSILCQMGSYLEASEIFNTFQRLNRRFFQMGNRPEVFVEWGFGYHYKRKNCQFDLIPMLNRCKLKRFNLNKHNVHWCKEINFARMNTLQHIESRMYLH